MNETDYNARLYEKMKAEQDKYRDRLLRQEPPEKEKTVQPRLWGYTVSLPKNILMGLWLKTAALSHLYQAVTPNRARYHESPATTMTR